MVRVTASGWDVISAPECPVRFKRARGMLALPNLVNGTIRDLDRLAGIIARARWPSWEVWGLETPRSDQGIACHKSAYPGRRSGVTDAINNRNTGIVCGRDFIARRGAKTCTPGCRQKAYRRRRVTDSVTDKPPSHLLIAQLRHSPGDFCPILGD